MGLLLTGIVFWSVGHLLPRVSPTLKNLEPRMARGMVALPVFLGLALMIIGFRQSPVIPVWTPPPWGIHLNNLMMLAAVALFGMGKSKGRARSWLRHPMLTGVIVWALAHLLVNGDAASILLFASMLVWAVVEILVINATAPAWVRPTPGTTAGDVRLAIITLAVFGIIVAVHTWLGYPPFPR